jgi:hypothetical protein
MRSPLAGRRAAARRLAEEVRRRLDPTDEEHRGALARSEDAAPAASSAPPGPLDPAARIDAARARLRATIEPPPDDADR